MKHIILFLITGILPVSIVKAQNVECIGKTIEIPLTGFNSGTLQWQFSADETSWVNIPGAVSETLSYTLTETGYFRARVSYGFCEYFSDTTYIEVYPEPGVANAGTDKNVLTDPAELTLNANSPVSGTGQWSVKSGISGSFADPSDPETVFSGIFGEKYVLTWTLSTGCKSSSDDVTIAFYDPLKVVSDYEGNIYYTVQIGDQVWMAENLKTTRYRNGDVIQTTIPVNKDITEESSPKYQWAFGGNSTNIPVYGRLYTWYAITDPRNVCPEGWHVPTDPEWTVLTDFLGGQATAGGKMKETGLSHWGAPNEGATNETGFTGLPGGFRHYNGTSDFRGSNGYYWSSTTGTPGYGWNRILSYDSQDVARTDFMDKSSGNSVRCLKD